MLFLACLAAPALAETRTVSLKGGKLPAITINAGDTIEFKNEDTRDHRIQANDGSFDTGKLKPGETVKIKFSKAGTFAYSCTLHPREKGTIKVAGKKK